MKSNIINIMRKEFARFFGDRRMLVTLILPGILIYIVYSFMGTAMQSLFAPDTERKPSVSVVNLPASLGNGAAGFWDWAQLNEISPSDIQSAREKVESKEVDLCVVFPGDFDNEVAVYDVSLQTPAPNIEIYFNSSEINSQVAYSTVNALLDAYESSLSNKFDINRGVSDADLATDEDTSATIISMLMPMLLMVFLYSGCVSIAPESIAGEKERGTIGAMLVSPLKRSEFAIGKILSLGVLAFLAGLVSAVATIMSLPKLMGGDVDISVNIYSSTDYIFLAMVILSTILLLVSLISILSAFAKTVKEANSTIMPLMILVMVVGVTGMFGGAQTEQIFYLIPAYNSVQCMSGIFSLDYSAANIAITAVSNIVYACVGGFVLTKMFNSEKIMFSR